MSKTLNVKSAAAVAGAAHGSANTPLRAEVSNKMLTVKIGIETLEWASKPENGGPLEGCKVDGPSQRLEWANDVLREMTRENEIGESPLSKFLDAMMVAAANNGSAALCWPNENPQPSSPALPLSNAAPGSAIRPHDEQTPLERVLRSHLWYPNDIIARGKIELPKCVKAKEYRQAADWHELMRKAESEVNDWTYLLQLYEQERKSPNADLRQDAQGKPKS